MPDQGNVGQGVAQLQLPLTSPLPSLAQWNRDVTAYVAACLRSRAAYAIIRSINGIIYFISVLWTRNNSCLLARGARVKDESDKQVS